MTLDEAIQHALEVAEEYQLAVDISDWFSSDVEKCEKCANEHRQLAEWLNDYKKLKAAIKKTATELYLYQEKARENRDDIIVGECIRILRENTEGLV